MDERYFQLLRTASFAFAALVALSLQRLTPHDEQTHGSVRTNLGLWLADALVMGIACGTCACTVSRWAVEHRIGLLNITSVSPWLSVPITVMVLDLLSYLWHRANHVFPFLWRFHQVHHSDHNVTVSTALRFHPGELLLSLPLRLVVVAALGAPVVGVVAFEAFFALSNLIEHGNIDLPANLESRLRGVLVTPADHRFHHTRAGLERNQNYGTIFAIWDRWLASYRPSSSDAHIVVGLTSVSERLGILAALYLPARSLPPDGSGADAD